MSKSTAHTVCRLCGGSGLPQHPVVVARKPPALCTAFVRPSADVVVPMPQPLPLAACAAATVAGPGAAGRQGGRQAGGRWRARAGGDEAPSPLDRKSVV